MKTKALIVLLLIPVSFLSAQTKTFTDPRDGNTYEIVKIENNWWFKDNLQYESRYAHCPNFNKKDSDCIEANFYPNTELDTICPKGWHVATLVEWEQYFHFMLSQNKVSETALKTETYVPVVNIQISDTTKQVQLFAADNLLNLKGLGWVQGRKWKNIGTITLWANNQALNDNKYHVHIGPNSYVKHTHEHNITDKPRRNRKFVVRCVCDDDSFK